VIGHSAFQAAGCDGVFHGLLKLPASGCFNGGMEWESEHTFRVGDVKFVRGYSGTSTPERFIIQKDHDLVSRYVELADRFHGGRIVELGIAQGGTTALLALLAEPSKLVAIERRDEVPALASFERVTPYFGVNQGDRSAIGDIADREFTDPLDLVIDDASHVYDLTLCSFEVLFPRLRPDGWYVIEDWSTQYEIAERARLGSLERGTQSVARSPLARIGVELMLSSITSPQTISQVTVDRRWIVVQRGPQCDSNLRLTDLYTDQFGWLDNDKDWYERLWEPTVTSSA
jgi:SAM-dependent methyltransferase